MIRILSMIGLLTLSTCVSQEPFAFGQEQSSPAESTTPNGAETQSIVIPAGTRIALSLSSPIAAKAAHPGFPVRAVSGFPVTVGSQVVIPTGSYFEGVIDKVKNGGPAGRTVQMHFTQIIYPNGYTMGMDGENSIARAWDGGAIAPAQTTKTAASGPHYVLAAAQFGPPPTPPAPPPPPHYGTIFGVVTGVTLAVTIAALLVHHYHGATMGILFDTGWQFDIVLNSPVTINLTSIPSGAVTPKVQL